jgi:hypothetical protein
MKGEHMFALLMAAAISMGQQAPVKVDTTKAAKPAVVAAPAPAKDTTKKPAAKKVVKKDSAKAPVAKPDSVKKPAGK